MGTRISTAILVIASLTAVSGAQTVLINEVFTGNPDYIEITNFSGATVNLNGWTLEATFGTTVYPTATLPPNLIIAPGESIVLIETNNLTLPVSSPTPPAGTQILNTGVGYGWVGTSSGAVALVDSFSVVRDQVVFAGPTGPPTLTATAPLAPFTNPIVRGVPNAGDAIYRINAIDTNDGSDFENQTTGLETPGTLNPGQSFISDITKVLMDDHRPPVIQFDTINQTFTATGIIHGLVTDAGLTLTDPAQEPLIGGTLSVVGTFSGPDITSLTNLILSPSTIILQDSTQTDQVTAINLYLSDNTTSSVFGGIFGATPNTLQRLTSPAPSAGVNRTGSGSLALDSLQLSLANEALTLGFRLNFRGPELLFVAPNFSLPTAPPMETAMASTPTGGFHIGVLHASFATDIFNLFVPNPLSPHGQGPFLGTDFDVMLPQMISLPLGTQPFHVTPDALGNYGFMTMPAAVPAGMTLDYLVIAVDSSGQPTVSDVKRLTF